ncbi:MAG: class I SAM-dependent methyltransferase [Chloroflexota bacterium]
METELEYGNWVRKKNLIVLGSGALAAGLLVLLPLGTIYRVIMAVVFVALLVSFLLPFYSYVQFSQSGGKVQEKFYALIIRCLGEDIGAGRLLDIGSGNGVLAVKLALHFPEAEVIGMDYWGEDWEYSRSVCEKNARTAGVENRVQFQKGDAAGLDFADDTFDGATSNLTFHEVKSVTDKRKVLQEALRVVKPGGAFSFIDYFYEEGYYGSTAEFEAFLAGLGLAQVELESIQLIDIPALLRHPKILGKVGLYGVKTLDRPVASARYPSIRSIRSACCRQLHTIMPD